MPLTVPVLKGLRTQQQQRVKDNNSFPLPAFAAAEQAKENIQ